jgi:hypothetical protein
MNQANDFCRDIMISGRSSMPTLVRKHGARRRRAGEVESFLFPDGSTARIILNLDPRIIEAETVIVEKYWIGGPA